MTTGNGQGNGQDSTSDGRDQFIPVRKCDITDALIEHGQLTDEASKAQFRQVCRMLGAIFHYEYFERLEALRRDYYYFDPGHDPRARFDAASLERSYGQLIESFTAVLKGANFVEVSHEEVERSHREDVLVRVSLRAPVEEFREVRFFRRGHHQETFEIPRWFGLRRRKVEAMVYDDVVLMVAMKSEADLGAKASKKRRAQRKSRAGSVLIKYFRDIASADLNALFPNVEVVMSGFDKLMLGVPALAGGVPILINLWSTITVLFLVVGFYLGVSAAVEESQLKTALAAVSGRGFLHLKGVVEALLTSLHIDQALDLTDFQHDLLDADCASQLQIGGERLGFLGEVSAAGLKALGLRAPATILEVDLNVLASRAKLVPAYAPQSPFPTIARDLNLIVPESVRWADLAATVRTTAGPALERVEYLDTYRDPQKDGQDVKRLHFSFTLRAADRTLTGPEADAIRDSIVATCQQRHGAKLLA